MVSRTGRRASRYAFPRRAWEREARGNEKPRLSSWICPDKIVIGRVIPRPPEGLQHGSYLIVDFPPDQQVFLARPGIDGDGRLRQRVESLQLVVSEFDHDGSSFRSTEQTNIYHVVWPIVTCIRHSLVNAVKLVVVRGWGITVHWRYLHSLISPRSSVSAAYPVLSAESSNKRT